MQKIVRTFEKWIVVGLLWLMILAVLVLSVKVGVVLIAELVLSQTFLLDLDRALDIFGFFLMVLIGLELLQTIKAYLNEYRVHAETVLLVALVAIARKVIILDYKVVRSEMLYGIAAMIVALGISYFLVRRSLRMPVPNIKPPDA